MSMLYHLKALYLLVAVRVESRPSSQQTVMSALVLRGFIDVLYTMSDVQTETVTERIFMVDVGDGEGFCPQLN